MHIFKKLIGKTSFYLVLAVITIYCIFPFYYAILTSLETGTALFNINYLPEVIKFENYRSVISSGSFPKNFLNSVIVSVITVCISLFLALTASYSLARVKFKGRSSLLLLILSVSMFPQVAVLTGLFELIRFMGVFNSLIALIFSYMIFTLPFTVWVLTTFMRDLPIELEEAAIIDGAGPFRTLFSIFLPLLWPAIATTGILAFIAAWNEFLFALTFIISNDTRTVPVAIALLSGATQYEVPWGIIMAASVIVTVPLIIVVLIFQNKIISGLTAGSVKG